MRNHHLLPALLGAGILLFLNLGVCAQEKMVWTNQEKPIVEQIRGLRKLDDRIRAAVTKELALEIGHLPVVPNQLRLAVALSHFSTESDFGRETPKEVTATLANAVREQPPSRGKPGQPDDA